MGDTPGSSCVMGEAEKQTDPSLDKAIDTSNLLAIQGFHFLFRCQIRLFVRWGISITNALGAQHGIDASGALPDIQELAIVTRCHNNTGMERTRDMR